MKELLNNNSNDMKTIVETFIIEETAPLIYDNEQLDKWNERVKELGLVGQEQITNTDKSPIPFMHLKQTTKATLEILCPVKVDVEKFSINPIPVEILDLIALSKNEKYFDKIQIWYDDKSPDPCCVGLVYDTEEHRKAEYSWYLVPYLIGKWGDVKQSFEELTQRAIQRFKGQEINRLKQEIRDRQRQLEDIDTLVLNNFGSTNNDLPF